MKKMRGECDVEFLERVRSEFSLRRQGHGRSYPKFLRELTLMALERGYPVTVVAQAAGVARQSIVSWAQKRGSRPGSQKAVELRVVPARVESAPAVRAGGGLNSETDPISRIHFRSGAFLEIPSSGLTAQHLIALSWSAS